MSELRGVLHARRTLCTRLAVAGTAAAGLILAPAAKAAPPIFAGNASLSVPAGGASTVVVLTKRLPLTGPRLRASSTMLGGTKSDGLTLVVLRSMEPEPGQVPAQVVIGKLPEALGGQVVRLPSGVNRDSGKDVWFGEKWLAPGRYQLYTVAAQSGTLRLAMTPSAQGRTLQLRTKRVATLVRNSPAPMAGSPPPTSAQGHTVDLASEGLAVRVLAVDLSVEADYTAGGCSYSGGPPGGLWLPGCPGGLGTLLSTGFVHPAGNQHLTAGAHYQLPAGRWGIGTHYHFVGTARSVNHYQAFLTY